MIEGAVLSGAVLIVIVIAVAIVISRRRRLEEKGADRLKLAVAEGQAIPPSLHPVIDPVLCVGSFSCTRACPEGEVIGVVDGVATLVEAAHCIGHGRCAVECPVGAIKLVFGTAEVGIDLPKTDDSFESGREGVYIIGELGGMGLIKNALRQGLVLGSTLKRKLGKSQATETLTDVVIVGGGPAGIACAVACRREGLDVRVLEQDTLGGCIAHYPRGKVVMSEQVEMPRFGPFGRALLSKEELLADLRALVKQNAIVIEEGHKVTGVQGGSPLFSVTTERNAAVQCRAVVLATGLRGTPRKLEVPGEDLTKVVYRLVEPEQYNGKRVLIVGGGDSAVEAAIQLAEESTARVSISYRQERFNRCKKQNREKIEQLIADGGVRPLWKTRVVSIDDKYVHLAPVLSPEEEKARAAAEAARAAAEQAEKKAEEKARAAEQERRRVDPDVTDPIGMAPPRDPERDARRQPTSITGKRRARPLGDDLSDASGAVAAFLELPSTELIEPGPERTRTFLFTPRDPLEQKHKTSSKSALRKEGAIQLKNDAVIVSIGGQLPKEFLTSVGVDTRRYHGEEKSGFGERPGRRGPSKAQVEAQKRRRLALVLTLLGVSIITGLLLMGREYYWLPPELRAQSPLHPLLKPSGLWGHGVGVVATLFMLANFIYAVRKRWRRIKGRASIRTWLTFHMFVGIMSPLVIAFHAAFLLNNLLAVWTWVALTIVVSTGIFGRFLFGFVPAQAGKVLQVSELREQVSEMTRVVQRQMAEAADFRRVTGIFDRATAAPRERTMVGALMRETTQKRKLDRELVEVKTLFKSEGAYAAYKKGVEQIARAKMQIAFYGNLKRIFRAWLVVHVVMSIFMVVLIGAHVGVTTYFGFRWIFSASAP